MGRIYTNKYITDQSYTFGDESEDYINKWFTKEDRLRTLYRYEPFSINLIEGETVQAWSIDKS